MKRYVLGVLTGVLLLCAGCGGREAGNEDAQEEKACFRDEITMMHIDAENPEFQKFIAKAEAELELKIHLLPCPENADNRQAKISTILSAGESSVDVFSVNDEMVSEFKRKGYLEPLNDTVMKPEIIKNYPESYIRNIAMNEGNIYSVPYFMDIMVYWVNKSMTGGAEIQTQEDFCRLLNRDFGDHKYGYGSAWDTSYVYNELSEFINLFGGSYYDWEKAETKEALTFLHDMVKEKQIPVEQLADQYEQMEQKFMDGSYASIFMYSGAMDAFVRAGVYKEDQIQVVPLPQFRNNATNIAAWQYVLNKNSVKKEAALRFLNYAAGREGSISYAKYMNRLPARLDIIREEELDIPGFAELRDYVEHTSLKERPFSSNAMEDISAIGTLFQKYMLDEISQEEFCKEAQKITDTF